MPTGLKLIFGREMKISIFRPKMDPGGQKSIFIQKIESSKFSNKVCLKMVLRGLKSIFDRKMKISNLKKKIDPEAQKSNFCQKTKS